MAATAWPYYFNALVTAMRGASGFQAPGTFGSAIPVFDSIEVGASNEIPSSMLVIGWVGDPDDQVTDPGNSTQGVATLGTNHHREETGVIRCMAIAKAGDVQLGTTAGAAAANTAGAARAAAFAIVDAVDVVLRASPDLGIVAVNPSRFAAAVGYVTGITNIQTWLNEGPVVRIEFDVTFMARI